MHLNPRARATANSELCGQLIMNAAFVAYETQKAKAQTAWLADSNCRIIYVFDTDVVSTWCAPWRTGPVDPITLGNGYGQVLPPQILQERDRQDLPKILEKERSQAEAVAWLLASRAIGASFSNGVPFLMADAHFQETMSVYEQVKRLAEAYGDVDAKAVDVRLDHQLGTVLRAIRMNLGSADPGPFNARNAGAMIGSILRRIDVRDTLHSHGVVRQWDAFRDIARIGNGIFKLSEYRPDGDALNEASRKAWTLVNEFAISPEGHDTIKEFKNAIIPVIGRAKSKLSLSRSAIDAEAIAQILYLNQRLENERAGVRVVLVTGDRSLVLAVANAAATKLPNSTESLKKVGFNCIRHLWSFVDAVDDSQADRARPQELFSGLLAFEEDIADADDFRDVLLGNSISPEPGYVNRIHESDVKEAYDRWNSYTRRAADTQRYYFFDPVKQEKISEILLAKLRSQNPAMSGSDLLAVVRETTARARDRANVEFSGIGASSLLDLHKIGIRNPPELMFDSLPITHKIFRDLALPERIFLTSEDFAARFHQIGLDCHQPDWNDPGDDDFRQECYLKYLVLGALFASANRWVVAEQLAESAVRIIERAKALSDPIRIRLGGSSGPRSHISGREGYFLLASSKRVRAQTEEEFEKARLVLLKARQCLREDRENESGLGVSFIRFGSEELAISLGRYYSARERAFQNAQGATEYDPCDSLAYAIYRDVDRLLSEREELRKTDGQAHLPKGDQLAFLSPGTATSISTSLIQTFVISEFRKSKKYDDPESVVVDQRLVEESIDTIINNTDLREKLYKDGFIQRNGIAATKPTIICSSLILLYTVVGDFVLGSAKLAVLSCETDAVRLFSHYKRSATHYDDWRYAELEEFTKRALRIGKFN